MQIKHNITIIFFAISIAFNVFLIFIVQELKMQTFNQQKDSPAWVFQTWAAFILSISMTTFGVVNLPVDNWIKGFMGMGLAFSVGSTFTLAKTTRDMYETKRLTSRIEEAKVEKLLSQHDVILK
jgi:hypothetical protein